MVFLFNGIVDQCKKLTGDNVEVAQHAAQSLIEMCAGNYNNQEVAVNGQIVVSINYLLGFLKGQSVSCQWRAIFSLVINVSLMSIGAGETKVLMR